MNTIEVNMPYGNVKIASKEELSDLVANHCKRCSMSNEMNSCSGEQAVKCEQTIINAVALFNSRSAIKWEIIDGGIVESATGKIIKFDSDVEFCEAYANIEVHKHYLTHTITEYAEKLLSICQYDEDEHYDTMFNFMSPLQELLMVNNTDSKLFDEARDSIMEHSFFDLQNMAIYPEMFKLGLDTTDAAEYEKLTSNPDIRYNDSRLTSICFKSAVNLANKWLEKHFYTI